METTNIIRSKTTRMTFPLLSALLLSLCTLSCDLDETPKDQIEEDVAYTSVDALYQNAVAALYSYVGGDSDGQGLQGTCRGVYDLQTFGSDEALLPTRGVDWFDGGIWQDLYRHSWNPGHEVVNNSWMYLYKVVALCNHSLATLDSHQSMMMKIQYDRFSAEIRALRAIYYWYLLDLYGRVPIVTSENISMNEVAQSERSEVFNFVRQELESILGYLPNVSSAESGQYYCHVTQAVAFFVLAKLYLNAEVYTDDNWTDGSRPSGTSMHFRIFDKDMNAFEACIHYCNLISQIGYRLEEMYEDNFSVHNDKSKENIWTIPMDQYLYTNQQQNMFRSYHFRHAAALGLSGENGSSASLTVLSANHYSMPDEDKRFALNYWSDRIFDMNGFIINDRSGKPFEYEPFEVAMDLSDSPYKETGGARMKKYEIDRYATESGKLMSNDIVLFRYSDVLLMQSEAKLRNGESGQRELDLIRRRVGMPTIPATLDNLYTERLIELAWEGWRRQDMIRYDRYKSTYTGENSVDEGDHHTIVYPIPSVAVTLNHNLRQNPGY